MVSHIQGIPEAWSKNENTYMRGRELTILEFVEYKGVASGNFEFPKARRGVKMIMQLMVGYGNFLYSTVITH